MNTLMRSLLNKNIKTSLKIRSQKNLVFSPTISNFLINGTSLYVTISLNLKQYVANKKKSWHVIEVVFISIKE